MNRPLLTALGFSLFATNAAWAASPDAALSDRPASERIGITVSLDAEWMPVSDGGARLFSEKDTNDAQGISAAFDVKRIGQRGTLAVGLGILDDDSTSIFAAAHRASLDLDNYYATASYRFAVRPWLQPYVSVAGGGTHAAMTLRLNDETTLDDHRSSHWSVFGRASLGLRLATPTIRQARGSLPPFGFAFLVEYGFQAGSALALRADPPSASDAKIREDKLPVAGVALGTLSRTFPFFRLGFALLF